MTMNMTTAVLRPPPSQDDSDQLHRVLTKHRNEVAMEYTSDLPAICCIPISNNLSTPGDEIQTDCTRAINNVLIRSGPHRFHAIASRDIKAGAVIVQCLPFAHALLVPPGMQGDELSNDDDSGAPKRCARCFVAAGDNHCLRETGRLFGRCSKCKVVSYCSRSCQVC